MKQLSTLLITLLPLIPAQELYFRLIEQVNLPVIDFHSLEYHVFSIPDAHSRHTQRVASIGGDMQN